MRGLGGNFEPKVGPNTCHGAKRGHERGATATFSDPCASLWAAVAKKSAICESHVIYYVLTSFYVSWRVPFHPQNGLGNAMCTRSFLFESPLPTSGAKVMPKVAPRQAQGRPKGPQGRQKTPPGHLKAIKNQPATPPGHPRPPGRLQGYPPVRKLTPKSIQKLNSSTAHRP